MNATNLPFDFVAEDAAVAGVDEAGRGPLAGPVVAAAVVLDPRRPIDGLKDSKRLTAAERVRLARDIRAGALAFALGYAGPDEIDSINILKATMLAMERAVLRLRVVPELVRIDGNQLPRFETHPRRYLLEAIVGGDDLVPAISAASILAKVCRDRLMRRWHRRYPHYGFDRHKGYATPQHLEALARLGPCPIHRRSFAPCAAETGAGLPKAEKGSGLPADGGDPGPEKGSSEKGSGPFFAADDCVAADASKKGPDPFSAADASKKGPDPFSASSGTEGVA
ncbi:MAG: ribonuclease HII [Gammaproteobacteria bacterium]|nr:ribonuclease HII [Gammaproteobacteria bacterium]